MGEREHGLLGQAIEALRTRRSPPEGASARVFARLEAQLGGPGGPDDGGFEAGSGGGHGTAAFAAKIVAATAGMAAGGLLVLKLGVLGYRSLAPSEPTPVIASAPAIIEATPPLAEPPVQPSPAPESAPESAIGSAPTSDEPSAVVRSPSKPTPTPAPTPDITAELALIEAARQAGSPEAAIAQLAKHALEFPQGTLRDEREALWAIASCERGALDDASQRVQALALRRPNSPLLDRVANACPALEKN